MGKSKIFTHNDLQDTGERGPGEIVASAREDAKGKSSLMD